MDCKDIKDNLSAFMDQELALAAEESIRVHLGECDQCALQYARLLKGWQALDAWDDVTPPDRMQRKVLDAVKPQGQGLSLRRVLSAAAVLLLVFGTAVYYSGQNERSVRDNSAGSRSPVQTADVGNISEDEIIANLLILQEEDFFEVLDELVRIDELPLAEEPSSPTNEPSRSSLDMNLLKVSKLKLFRKSLLTSLCQPTVGWTEPPKVGALGREELLTPLWKRGERGDLFNASLISTLVIT